MSAQGSFEGEWVEYWPNTQVKYRGYVSKGCMRKGLHLAYFENGVLSELSYWKDGWITGTLMQFNEVGERYRQVDYGERGGFNRDYTERTFIDDTLWTITTYEKDVQKTCWFNKNVPFDPINNSSDSLVLDALEQMMGGELDESGNWSSHIDDAQLE